MGATRRGVMGVALVRTIRPVGVGIAVGALGALVATVFLESVLGSD